MSGSVMPFVKKEHPDMPDFYGITVKLITGRSLEYEGSHVMIDKAIGFAPGERKPEMMMHGAPYVEIATKDDKFVCIPFSSIECIEFDKRYSKVVAIRKETMEKEMNKTKTGG
jgi:hypothetical protein